MSETRQDIYDIEFKDIYEIEFLDFAAPTETAPAETEAAEVADPVPKPEGEAQVEPEVAPTLGKVAIEQAEMIVEPAVEPAETIQPAPAPSMRVEVLRPTLQERQPANLLGEIPAEIQAQASRGVDQVMAATHKAIIPYIQIIETIRGGGKKFAKDKERLVIDAIMADGRLEYFSNGCYLVKSRSDEVMRAYAEGRDPFVDPVEIYQLVDTVIQNVDIYHNEPVPHENIKGVIKRHGGYLNKFELALFMKRLHTHPLVTLTSNGDFKIDRPKPTPDKPKYAPGPDSKPPVVVVKPVGIVAKNGESLTPTQTRQAIKMINGTSEVAYARREGKRLANTRPRGRNFRKRSKGPQGRFHGKKVTIDSLLNAMNRPPKA